MITTFINWRHTMQPVNSTELFNFILAGNKPVVKFLKGAEDFETCIDRGMYGRIVGVEHKQDDFYLLRVDLNEFESHNDGCMQRNYYDTDGNPCLTSKEAGQYPKDGVESVYLDYGRDLTPYFEFDESNVKQIVSIKVVSAGVYQSEGCPDIIIVEVPAPMPISGIKGNVKMTLIADEGTGVDYMKTHFGIVCETVDGSPDLAAILAGYGLDNVA